MHDTRIAKRRSPQASSWSRRGAIVGSRRARSGRVDSWRSGASCTYQSLAGLRKPPAPASETRAARASPLSTRVLREHVVRLWRCFGLTSAPITHFTSRRLEKTRQFWTKTGHFWTKTMRKWTSGREATIFRVVLGRRALFGCRLRRRQTRVRSGWRTNVQSAGRDPRCFISDRS